MLSGGTFLHVGVPNARSPTHRGALAIQVARDGHIDFGSTARGVRVYGDWPHLAWLQTSSGPQTDANEFSRWRGDTWTKDPSIGASVVSLLPWRDHTYLVVERGRIGGTQLSVADNGKVSSLPPVPPEMARFDAGEMFANPKAGIVVMTGAIEHRSGYTIVAGATARVLQNTLGRSLVTAAPACNRILFSHWTEGAQGSGPQQRAVRILGDRIVPGEELPAEVAQFAIDSQCHEWLISVDGALFEQHDPSAGWRRLDVPGEGKQPAPISMAALADRVWVSIGTDLYVAGGRQLERVALPDLLAGKRGAIFLQADEHANRLFAVVVPVNDQRGTILTTGAVPQRLRCDELASKIVPE